jgi:chromosome partitioning protein
MWVLKGRTGYLESAPSALVAREYANAGWSVKIADLDIAQSTSFAWQGRRLQAGIEPIIPVERFGTVGNHEPEAVTPRASKAADFH